MNALLVCNNTNVQNMRVLVEITDRKSKEKVIRLLEENKGAEAFDFFFSNAEVKAYLPGETPHPRIPMLITLDEELLKSKPPAKLTTVSIPKSEPVCYT